MCDVGPERFMAPELYFSPELFHKQLQSSGDGELISVQQAVDEVVQTCPIDYKRRLYKNVVICGGSSLFVHFRNRLQRELLGVTARRLERYETVISTKSSHVVGSSFPNSTASKGGGAGVGGRVTVKPTPIEVDVHPHKNNLGAQTVWFGGSLLAALPQFPQMCISKQEYEEWGVNAVHNRDAQGGRGGRVLL